MNALLYYLWNNNKRKQLSTFMLFLIMGGGGLQWGEKHASGNELAQRKNRTVLL